MTTIPGAVPRPLARISLFILLALLVFAATAPAQTSCPDPANRYRQDVFGNVTTTADIQYGSAHNPLFNRTDNLLLDIYSPSGDNCKKRPLLIFVHGGWFQGLDRKFDAPICQRFAKRGYVACSIDYRMAPGGVYTPVNFMTPAYMSSQDARAVVRFFRKNADKYGIDTSLIYVGGCSAGGYTSMATAYMDKMSEIPSYVDTNGTPGGIDGISGNPGYSSQYAGGFSISGGILDTAMIQKGDKPMVSVQCQDDPIVSPGGDSLRNPDTHKGFLYTYGSTAVHTRLGHMNVPNHLYTFQKNCHCAYTSGGADLDTTVNFITASVYQFMSLPTAVQARRIATRDGMFAAGPARGFLIMVGSREELSGLLSHHRVFTLDGHRLAAAEEGSRSGGLYLALPKE